MCFWGTSGIFGILFLFICVVGGKGYAQEESLPLNPIVIPRPGILQPEQAPSGDIGKKLQESFVSSSNDDNSKDLEENILSEEYIEEKYAHELEFGEVGEEDFEEVRNYWLSDGGEEMEDVSTIDEYQKKIDTLEKEIQKNTQQNQKTEKELHAQYNSLLKQKEEYLVRKVRIKKKYNSFQARLEAQLFENVPFSDADDYHMFDIQNELPSLQVQMSQILSEKASLRNKKKNVTKKKYSLKQALKVIEEDIQETNQGIIQKERAIRTQNNHINETVKEIKTLREKIKKSRQAVLGYIAYIYLHGNLVFHDNSQDVDLLKTIIMNEMSSSEVLSDLHTRTVLGLTGKKFVDAYRDFVNELKEKTALLTRTKVRNIRAKHELRRERQILKRKELIRERLLKQTTSKEAQYNRFIVFKQNQEEVLENRMRDIQKRVDEAVYNVKNKYGCVNSFEDHCQDFEKFFENEKRLHADLFFDDGNLFLWPIEPDRGISAFFHDPAYAEIFGLTHYAIDIPAYQNTEIVAPADGYVIYIRPPLDTGYSYVALKHANGFTTVYGHLHKVFVKEFDYVEAGEVFARSGGMPGTLGAGRMTTGPHLHFEVYKDKKPTDPLNFMDLSYLPQKTLDARYAYKYARDYQGRYGEKADLAQTTKFYLGDGDEVTRQQNLLKKYGIQEFQAWNIWVEESLKQNIDPSFLMCIGLAESTLGRYMKTAYNIGNVGNTDSGATRTFSGPREGIRAMAEVLNNKYLGSYETMDQLSRWGNSTGPIYASSPANWHNNLVKCLSAIKGRHVEDNFNFRLHVEK